MVLCIELTNYGMVIRILSTVILFFILYSLMKGGNKFYNKYFLVILAVLLFILDSFDNIAFLFYRYYRPGSIESTCSYEISRTSKIKSFYEGKINNNTLYYSILDKCVDTLSYILAYFVFNLNNTFLYFLLYRMIGIGLYIYTQNTRWLIVFFDFMKEYLIYFFFLNKNLSYIWIFIIIKIIGEIVLHYY
jgi:hypothetical protein